jgi:hypothetical protein
MPVTLVGMQRIMMKVFVCRPLLLLIRMLRGSAKAHRVDRGRAAEDERGTEERPNDRVPKPTEKNNSPPKDATENARSPERYMTPLPPAQKSSEDDRRLSMSAGGRFDGPMIDDAMPMNDPARRIMPRDDDAV